MQEKYKTIVKLGKQYGFPQTEEKELEKLRSIHNIHPFHTILGNENFLGEDARLILLNEDEETTGCVIIYDYLVDVETGEFIRVWKNYDLRIEPNQDLQYAIHSYDIQIWPEFHENELYIIEVDALLRSTTCENYDQFLFTLNSNQKDYVLNSKSAQDKIKHFFRMKEEDALIDVNFN